MANNRMYLVHHPSGRRVVIAKDWGHGWRVFEPDRLQRFLDGIRVEEVGVERQSATSYAIELDEPE